ncbi:MAG: hypothetical protein U0838_05935 [Chloroflexota bacterium]
MSWRPSAAVDVATVELARSLIVTEYVPAAMFVPAVAVRIELFEDVAERAPPWFQTVNCLTLVWNVPSNEFSCVHALCCACSTVRFVAIDVSGAFSTDSMAWMIAAVSRPEIVPED